MHKPIKIFINSLSKGDKIIPKISIGKTVRKDTMYLEGKDIL